MTITPTNTLAPKFNTDESQTTLTFDTHAGSADIVLCPANSTTAYLNNNKSFNLLKPRLNLSISTNQAFILTPTTTSQDQSLIKSESRKSKISERTQPIYQDPQEELKKISDQILSVEINESNKINLLSNWLGELRKQIPKNDIEDIKRGNALHKSFIEILKQNKSYQEGKVEFVTTEIKEVNCFILQNDFKKAQSKWNKIQSAKKDLSSGTLKKISKIEAGTKKSYYSFRDSTLKENFIKKEELVDKMLLLLSPAVHGAERINQIKKIHNDWKIIGISHNERKLWEKFKQASDQAYKSCKEYFEKRNELKISNAKEKNNLCDVLETKLTTLSVQKIDIKSITLLLKEIDASWRKYSPVDDDKVKDLNKRYYRLTSSLRSVRKNEFKSNETCKKSIILEANELSATNPEKKNKIKALQAQWKTIKSAGAKRDEVLWKEFREICDTFFQQKLEKTKAPQTDNNEKKIHLLLGSFKNLANASFLELEKPQTRANELRHELKSLLETYHGDKKSLITRQLRGYQHQIDLKISALPNSKQSEALDLVISANQYLEGLEDQLFDTSNNETYSAAFNEIKSQEIPSFQLLQHPPAQEALRSRTQNLKLISSYEGFSNEIIRSEQEMRLLCVEIELIMGLKTPDDDRVIRTEMNLQQLKKMFGKEKLSKPEIIKTFHMNYLTIKAMGPLPSQVKKKMQARYEDTLPKYLSNSSF